MQLAPSQIVNTLGIITAVYILSKVFDLLWVFSRPSNLHRYLHRKNGEPAWALVTGASDGIGKALCFELASRGFNVVLHGRNRSKLETVHDALRQAHPTREFRVLILDATTCQKDGVSLAPLAAELADLHLTVLINNAGGQRDDFRCMHEYTKQELIDSVNLNATFTLLMTHAFLPTLIKNAPSLCVNVGSLADNGVPTVASYAASKNFVNGLSRSLANEMLLQGHDVTFMAMRVGMVTGTVEVKMKRTLTTPDTVTFARALLNRVGCGRTVVVPYVAHALQQMAVDLLPEGLKNRILVSEISKLKAEGLKEEKRKAS
ncbi:putative short chain dehydrogenase protein [Mycena venus]|uniref:Putative short chain dehydrogenase protein n=1 Tax=Mycena venus TaxID=2733690 RepID=A0A8H6XKF2_9AGAR|nr:putative short chain dehydrogenase protein [Mycena venus]